MISFTDRVYLRFSGDPVIDMSSSRFECPTCGKELKAQANLDDHMNTHTRNAPHECSVLDCNMAYRHRGSLWRHQNTGDHRSSTASVSSAEQDHDYRAASASSNFMPHNNAIMSGPYQVQQVAGHFGMQYNVPRSTWNSAQPYANQGRSDNYQGVGQRSFISGGQGARVNTLRNATSEDHERSAGNLDPRLLQATTWNAWQPYADPGASADAGSAGHDRETINPINQSYETQDHLHNDLAGHDGRQTTGRAPRKTRK
jgi:hypothetical protein